MIARELFRVGVDGNVSITGGTIECGALEMGPGASMDINKPGVIIIDGDALTEVWNAVRTGRLTGCGAPQGIVADYGQTNPGKTTVTGTCDYCGCCAWLPTPADDQTEVHSAVTEVELCWEPGDSVGGRGKHGVYFSTDYDCVENGDIVTSPCPCFLGMQRADELCWNVGNLLLWTTGVLMRATKTVQSAKARSGALRPAVP